ncbi:MAG TPA: FHA domain-containing protein, partial [Polyangiaceae bacterium]|nr:FHA domain-containing protein [Polyangiaceae bacterium]
SESSAKHVVCERCQTRNPAEGKYCVTCGAPLHPSPPIANLSPIPPAGVIQVSPPDPPTASPQPIICDRCQGICDGGMRFCKYCGAPLPNPSFQEGPPQQVAEPSPALNSPSAGAQDYVFQQQNNISESARAAVAPPTPPPGAPNMRAESTDRSRTRPSTSQGLAQPHPLLADQPAGTKTGQYIPFSGSSTIPAGRLVVVGSDGREGPSFPLVGDQVDIGRSEGAIVLSEDHYMSPRHARLLRVNGSWFVRDLNSTNGVFVRLRSPHPLQHGDLLLLGVEVLKFETAMDAELDLGPAVQHGTLVFGSPALARCARLVQRTVEGVARDVYHLHRLETVLGRESGDIVFTDDPCLSRRHAVIRRSSSSGTFTLEDLNSSNGSFVAIRGDCALQDGDSIRVGQHLFRVELA